MFRKMTIAKRFGFILFLIFIITLPLITSVMYYFFRENAIREVADKALLTMHSMDSLRKYVGKELRPTINKELPKKFVLEGESGFYILRKVSYNLQEVQPYYIYKQATNNPLAIENRADYYEEWFLKRFRENGKLKEITGLRTLLHRQAGEGRPAGMLALPRESTGCAQGADQKIRYDIRIQLRNGLRGGDEHHLRARVGAHCHRHPVNGHGGRRLYHAVLHPLRDHQHPHQEEHHPSHRELRESGRPGEQGAVRQQVRDQHPGRVEDAG
jgi:Protein of unknown function (DUF3365)